MILRVRVLSEVRNTLRASCWVSVLAPGLPGGHDVVPQDPHQSPRVDPVVVVEPFVLDRDDGVAKRLRDPVQGHERAVLGEEFLQGVAVGREKHRLDRRLDVLEAVEGGQITRKPIQQDDRADGERRGSASPPTSSKRPIQRRGIVQCNRLFMGPSRRRTRGIPDRASLGGLANAVKDRRFRSRGFFLKISRIRFDTAQPCV